MDQTERERLKLEARMDALEDLRWIVDESDRRRSIAFLSAQFRSLIGTIVERRKYLEASYKALKPQPIKIEVESTPGTSETPAARRVRSLRKRLQVHTAGDGITVPLSRDDVEILWWALGCAERSI